jgi:hypothetical protein
MESTSRRVEIENFNGRNFELWKLKMENLLVDRDLWIFLSRSELVGMKQEDWDLSNKKSTRLIRICLANFVLLNVHEEKAATYLWKKLGDIYQGKSLVNKLFLRKKLYSFKMEEGEFFSDHLNAFNILIS